MFTRYAFTALAALVSAQVAFADVTPSEPGPNASYTAGKTCRVTWDADTESTTAWKNMAIQLMSGSNFDMQHVTTVATNQDGTVSGVVEYTCPEVNPYSTIYFYQFTAPNAPNKAWTTRFTITSPSGETTTPENPTQPGAGDPIPWGIGALADPSQAVAPPASAGGSGATGSTGSSAGSSAASSTATAGATGSSSAAVVGATSSRMTSSSASASASGSSAAAAAASSTPSSTPSTIENGALSNLVDSRVLQAALLFSATVLIL